MKFVRSIITIFSCLILLLTRNCGYTILSKPAKAEIVQTYPKYLIDGLWIKTETGHDNEGMPLKLEYNLLLNPDGSYGFDYHSPPNSTIGDYYISSDTLTLISEEIISKYLFDRNGKKLTLSFISFEQRKITNVFPPTLEGEWHLWENPF